MSNRVRSLFAAALVAALTSGVGARPMVTFTQTPTQKQTSQGAAVSTATLSGVVADNGGGAIPGATVAITKVDTGLKLPPATTNAAGQYSFTGLAPGKYKVTISLQGFKTLEIEVTLAAGSTSSLNSKLEVGSVSEVVMVTAGAGTVRADTPTVTLSASAAFIQTLPRSERNALDFLVLPPGATGAGGAAAAPQTLAKPGSIEEVQLRRAGVGNETYSYFVPNPFLSTLEYPLSTFGADVDTASYTNIRRFLSQGQLPPSAAVRVEELVNYFHFPYAAPRDGQPIALTTEIGDCPWAPGHKLALIGARAAMPPQREVTGRNIVLLIDVSGSMAPPERLPLIKTALSLFVDTLRPTDTLAIVTYAGSSGVALQATPARQRDTIQRAIDGLSAGGSTNGAAGLVVAYQIARQAFVKGGVNRVILATDGDFNVGVTSQGDLLQLIEQERRSGVFLSVLGVGSGNLKDATMEMLADKGNGHYAYLDSLQEARRVLIKEGDATLEAAAKDVKFQVEFNPAVVAKWKLIGYENRALAARDFNDDRKDAGEMGAGHTVTVLYEIVPVGVEHSVDLDGRPEVDPLKYQPQASTPRPSPRPVPADLSGEWFTVKARYKMPDSEVSSLISRAARFAGTPQNLALASAVVEFGLILRDEARDMERWDGLVYRLDRMTVPNALQSEFEGFRDMVATARGLARIR